jgi:hypothetical protein
VSLFFGLVYIFRPFVIITIGRGGDEEEKRARRKEKSAEAKEN